MKFFNKVSNFLEGVFLGFTLIFRCIIVITTLFVLASIGLFDKASLFERMVIMISAYIYATLPIVRISLRYIRRYVRRNKFNKVQ